MIGPKCKGKMRSVSALTHGCVPGQRLYLMHNGKLADGGYFPVKPEKKKKKLWADILYIVLWLAWITMIVWMTIDIKL